MRRRAQPGHPRPSIDVWLAIPGLAALTLWSALAFGPLAEAWPPTLGAPWLYGFALPFSLMLARWLQRRARGRGCGVP